MILDKSFSLEQRIQIIQKKFIALKNKLDLEQKTLKLNEIKALAQQSDFWDNSKKAEKISREIADLSNFILSWREISREIQEFVELLKIASENELQELEKELVTLEQKFYSQETLLLLSGEYDSFNTILTINTGNGGQDAEDFSQILLRMYLRFAEKKGFKTSIIDKSESDVGLKSATISIKGFKSYGLLKHEHGVHRLIRLSPFNAKNLRQTSFSRIEILPEIEQETDIVLDEKDLRVDVFRSSGSGGQSVNTTDSAVRVTYLPLNISVSCQNEKSQLQNKNFAIKILKSRLLQLKLEQNIREISELKGELLENSFGSQIRTYTLQPYKLVKDHRTNFEHNSPDKVFDGELDGFIEASLRN